jgi:hypothetical protein
MRNFRCALLLAFLLALPATAGASPGRFALLIGANVGDRHEAVLRHAEDDATRLAQTFRTLGDFPADQVLLMTGATASELRDALIRLNARIREQREAVLMVFYSGHADAESLHLAGTRLPMAELKALLVGSPAASRVLIVDACRSGSLIQIKGAHPVAPFPVPVLDEPVPEGFAVLTSSTATEDSQESAALGSSFFSYYLNSGLIGGADQDRDGSVTLSELYAFASSETRVATARTPVGPQNPTFQFQLGGRRDLVLTRPGRRDLRVGGLLFAQAGRYVVQRWDRSSLSPPVAEIAASDRGAQIALPAGRYRVTLRGERTISERDFEVRVGETTQIEIAQLARVDIGRTVRKGETARASATGFAVTAGWHTDQLGGAGRSLILGAGPSALIAVRHDRRWFSLEARVGLDKGGVVGPTGIRLDNQGVTPALAVLFPFDVRTVTLAAGLEVGVAAVRQSFTTTEEHPFNVRQPLTPALSHPRWSTGLQGALLGQLDFPLGARTYLRLETAVIGKAFDTSPSAASGSPPRGLNARFTAGAGAAF